MLAKINGVFRLTRDAELRYTQNGQCLVKLGLACSEKFKEKETTLFIDAVAFGKPAELINQYCGTKGSQIALSGKLQTEQWVDQNQQKRSKISMTIESFEFLGSRDSGYAPQRDSTTRGPNYDGHGRYDESQQQPQQQQDYSGGTYKAPQQQSYQQPQPSYENKSGDSVSQESHQATQNAHKQMPKPNDVPVIDIDEDEIPF